MEKIKITGIIVSLLVLVILAGCMKDDINLKDPSDYNRPLNIAGPIFKAHFSAKDLLNKLGYEDYIYADTDKLLHAKIDTSFEIVYDDIITFDDLELDVTYSIPSSGESTKALLSFIDTVPATLDDDQRFDSLTMASAFMEIEVHVPNGFTGPYTVSFPEIIKPDGNTFVINGNLADGDKRENVDISGSRLTFIQAIIAGISKSSFRMVTSIDGTPVGTPANTDIRIKFKLHNYKPGEIWGYFGKRNVNNIDITMDLGLSADSTFTDAIQFKTVDLKLATESKFGIPISVLIDSIFFKNRESGDNVLLEKDTIHIEAAKYTVPDIEAIQDSIVYDVTDAINIAPDIINFKMSRWVNWFEDKTKPNFLVNNGKTDMFTTVKLHLPFWFKTSHFSRTDTIGFNVREKFDDETIEYLDVMNIYFTFDNGFPFDINAQAYVVDSVGTVIDSLLVGADPVIWKSPTIDSEGKADGTEKSSVTVTIDSEKVKNLYNKHAIEILLESWVKTGGLAGSPDTPEFVKLFENYTIDVTMSLDTKSNGVSIK